MNGKKPHVKIVILGNGDAGKTTMAGHLIYKCGVIDKRIFHRFERETIEMGKNSFKYAWIFDRMKGECERGVTIDISSWQFEISKNYITLMDGPGNRNFMRCMITSIKLANCALLMVPASLGEFEASMSKYSSMRKQISFAYTMGIEHMIVAINKMDTTVPPYSQDRFNEIKIEVLSHLKKIGYQSQSIIFIPVSAWLGDNLIELSNQMSWFEGQTVNSQESTVVCKTLVEAMDSIVLSPPPMDKPLRLILQHMYKTQDAETMLVGYVETGILKSDMIVQFTPTNLSAQIKSIEIDYETLEEALPGDKVIFTVYGISTEKLQSGFICSDAKNDPAEETANFIAQINILYHPSRITKGYKCLIHCHLTQIPCEFTELLEKMDRKSGQPIESNPQFLRSEDIALVKIIPLKSVCVEKHSDYPSLGRFVIFDQEWIIAVGSIKHIEKKKFFNPMNNKFL